MPDYRIDVRIMVNSKVIILQAVSLKTTSNNLSLYFNTKNKIVQYYEIISVYRICINIEHIVHISEHIHTGMMRRGVIRGWRILSHPYVMWVRGHRDKGDLRLDIYWFHDVYIACENLASFSTNMAAILSDLTEANH